MVHEIKLFQYLTDFDLYDTLHNLETKGKHTLYGSAL